MNYIKVWCEYDFGGSFGGNNNEDIVIVDESIDINEITERLETYLSNITGLEKEELEGLWDWDFVGTIEMKVRN